MSTGTAGAGGGGPSPDIQSKYTKLAAEYAKLRAQVGVLKRAVVDEQTKNVELTENLQLRDQSIRKLDQEVDSLNFRNKQLEKRIGFLQSELTQVTSQTKGKSKKPKDETDPFVSSSSASLDYELISKIEENMRLQKQLSDLEQSTQFEVEQLKSQLEARDNEDTHKELILNELTSLKSENESLTCALQNSFDEIEAYREQAAQLREKITKSIESGNTTGGQKSEAQHNFSSSSEFNLSKVETGNGNDGGGNEPQDLLEKLKDSEQRREYWALEFQLLNMKYQRVIKKWDECKELLQSIGRDDLLQSTSSELTTPVTETTNFLGRMEVVESDEQGDADLSGRSYEKQVKEYMTLKVNELVALLQYADSRALYFFTECKSMESLLTISCSKSDALKAELESLKRTEATLQEELELTKGNYETQLTQLSEHLALMNDKIAEKQDWIEELQSKIKSTKR